MCFAFTSIKEVTSFRIEAIVDFALFDVYCVAYTLQPAPLSVAINMCRMVALWSCDIMHHFLKDLVIVFQTNIPLTVS